MARGADPAKIRDYWARDGLGQAIFDALADAGKDMDALTVDDVAPADQFHGGGSQQPSGWLASRPRPRRPACSTSAEGSAVRRAPLR